MRTPVDLPDRWQVGADERILTRLTPDQQIDIVEPIPAAGRQAGLVPPDTIDRARPDDPDLSGGGPGDKGQGIIACLSIHAAPEGDAIIDDKCIFVVAPDQSFNG